MEYTTNILKKSPKTAFNWVIDDVIRFRQSRRLPAQNVRALWDQVARDVFVQVRRKVCVHAFPRPSGNQV